MAERPIDANAMLNELRPVSFEAEHSAVLLSDPLHPAESNINYCMNCGAKIDN